MLEETNATVDIPDNISELTLKIKGNTYGCMDDWGNKAFEAYSFFAGNEDKNFFFEIPRTFALQPLLECVWVRTQTRFRGTCSAKV